MASYKNRLKRVADMLEKFSIGSLILGIYQDNKVGIYIAVICIILSLAFTKEEKI